MKKLSYLLGLLLIGGIIFSSCSKEDTATAPSVSFLGGVYAPWGAERIDQDVTLTVGEAFVFGFTASSTSDKNLTRIKVTRNYENVSMNTVMDSAVSVASFTVDIETVAYPNTPGSEVFTITITDKNDLSTSISFTVTTVAAEPNISTYTNISLGSYTSTTPSSFASITGETFSVSQANDPVTQKKIDFVYFHGGTYGHTVASPASAIAGTIYSTTVATWATENRNHTSFGLTNLTVAAYNAVETKSQLILSIQNDGVALDEQFQSQLLSNPAGFAVGDIIAFETYDGNQGLIKLTEINVGATNGASTIKYDLKVEKPANR